MASETPLSDVRFLTVAEVALIMRVSKMTVYRLVHSGELEAIRVGDWAAPADVTARRRDRAEDATPRVMCEQSQMNVHAARLGRVLRIAVLR